MVLVAGGIGLAPLRPAICHLLAHRDRYGELNLIIGAREPSRLLYATEYDAWRVQGLNVHVTVDRANSDWHGAIGRHGAIGMVTNLLDRLWLPQPENTLLLSCRCHAP